MQTFAIQQKAERGESEHIYPERGYAKKSAHPNENEGEQDEKNDVCRRPRDFIFYKKAKNGYAFI